VFEKPVGPVRQSMSGELPSLRSRSIRGRPTTLLVGLRRAVISDNHDIRYISTNFKYLFIGTGMMMIVFLAAAIYLAKGTQTAATGELGLTCSHVIALLAGGFLGLAGGKAA
jgi:hypothetical protein